MSTAAKQLPKARTGTASEANGAPATEPLPPFAAVVARVEAVERISPSFVRITLGGDELRDVGNPDRTLDQRIKLVFPPASGGLARIPSDQPDWYGAWLEIPETERGSMRTYSIRRLEVDPDGVTRLVIDFVLHLAEGATGPASLWASRAAIGDEVTVVAPRRGRLDGGGIEFDPGNAERIVLVGDETAAPAIARILEELPRDARGTAYIEVPLPEDRLEIAAPEGFDVRWLVRDDDGETGRQHGESLIPEALAYLGERALPPIFDDTSTEELVWETPQRSEIGEPTDTVRGTRDEYFWIAGESGVVTTLRRHLVRDHGIERARVAFMGYWRRGVAMRG